MICVSEFLHIQPSCTLIKKTNYIKQWYSAINQTTQIQYVDWGSNFNEWVCCRSIRAYSQFSSQLSTSKKIPHDIAARLDELVSATNSEEMAESNTSQNTASFDLNALPDLETICKKKIPTLRFIPVKFRLRWSELLTPIIEGCVSQPIYPENWKRLFAISKCVLRSSNRVGKKHKQQPERLILTRFERWKNGDYAGLWFEAVTMEQAKKMNHDSMETLAARAKSLCLQGQFGRAAKILSSDGVAPDNKETLNELMILHPAEEVPPRETDDYSSYFYQFDEASVFKQLQSFSNFTAAGPSKMYPEHLLQALTCIVPAQSKKLITSITKLVKLARRGKLPSFVAPIFSSASLKALKKTKGGVRPIAVGDVFPRFIAKSIAQEASSEAVELFFIHTTWGGS